MRVFMGFGGAAAAACGTGAILLGGLGLAAALALSGAAPALPPAAPAWALLALAGLVSGFFAGMLGIGGALVTAPALYAALPALGAPAASLAQSVVAATLLTMLPTTLAVMHFQARRGAVDVPALRRFAAPMTAGAVVGGLLAMRLHGPIIPLAFAAQSVCYGTWLMFKGSQDGVGMVGRWLGRQSPWWTVSTVAGFCACVGMGGASMVTPYLRCRALPLKAAVATSSALNLCIAIGGSATFIAVAAMSSGSSLMLSAAAAAVLATFAVLAAPGGVALAHRLPVRSFAVLVGAINVVGAMALIGHVTSSQSTRSPEPTRPLAEAIGLHTDSRHPERVAQVADAKAATWGRLTLHALLIPLIETEGEPAWAAPHDLMPCAGSKDVTMDGRAIPYGRVLPTARPFVLAFRLKDCWPLGDDWLGLSGTLEMTVVRQRDQLLVQLRPLQLEAAFKGGSMPLTQSFGGVVELDLRQKN